MKTIAQIIAPRARIPPTTPPAIAPAGVECRGDGVGVGVGGFGDGVDVLGAGDGLGVVLPNSSW